MRKTMLIVVMTLLGAPMQGSLAATPLGEINIELYGNIVDFTCVAEGSDSN